MEFLGSDARLQGIEAHADVRLTSRLSAEVGLDYVHGQLKNEGLPLPRIPPLRGRVGLRYQVNAFQVGGEVRATTTQHRVSGVEEPTEGSQLLKLFASYSFVTGQTTSTVTARLDNVTDELYRNHLSLIKAHVPERGATSRFSTTCVSKYSGATGEPTCAGGTVPHPVPWTLVSATPPGVARAARAPQ